MRLTHFCIGSMQTQDLLISKTFRTPSQSSDSNNIQEVWATFLDLFQQEQHWTPLRSQLHPDRNTVLPGGSTTSLSSSSRSTSDKQTPSLSSPPSAAGKASVRQVSPRQTKEGHQANPSQLLPATVSTPLFSKDTSFIYRIVNDLVLVACCPPPPTPITLNSNITRIPQPIPGQPKSRASAPSSSALSPQGDSTLLLQEKVDKQPNKLAFTNSISLQVSLHHMVEFLVFLTKAMERYLLGENTAGGNRASVSPPQRSSSQFAPGGPRKSGALPILSADLVQLNSGIVYEILDECLEQGFPMMPNLAQLDLLVFGVPTK
ncbi:hypothetical protein MVEG_07662 [Podila verticillata NRRL 6337]|nr:MAG: hypothetical protein BYD32DRAFT_420500 [Podila humilis]KFH67139.1 hypothetical protein MVEG_07662 [Podila verticillata NRRL 6337]